jgi:hypothetical protein
VTLVPQVKTWSFAGWCGPEGLRYEATDFRGAGVFEDRSMLNVQCSMFNVQCSMFNVQCLMLLNVEIMNCWTFTILHCAFRLGFSAAC